MADFKGFSEEKTLVRNYFADMEKCEPKDASDVLAKYVSPDYYWEGVYPFLDKKGGDAVAQVFWTPLKTALCYMQRRQDVFIAGVAKDNKTWVMSMGQMVGLFNEEFLGIRPTYKMQHLQYAEYCCVENGKITHTAMFVDLIGFMMEAGVYPLAPMTGNYFVYPGPRDHNGLLFEDASPEDSKKTMQVVEQMIDELQVVFEQNITSKEETYKVLKRTWAEDMTWYGPCGEGAGYTIKGYQRQHHHPFCDHMPSCVTNEIHSYFAEGAFACFFTSLQTNPTGGYLGLPGGRKNIHMRGDIDIYYVKDGKISENWCFIDVPYWLNEQGLDIFDRTKGIYNPEKSEL